MADGLTRALCDLADEMYRAVSLAVAGDARGLGAVVDRATAQTVALCEQLLRAFCPSLPRKETILLAEALHGCMLTAQHLVLTLPPHIARDALGAPLCRLAAHLRQEVLALPHLLRGKRTGLPSPRARAEAREGVLRMRTQLQLRSRQGGAAAEAAGCYEALLEALTEVEGRYLALALECS